MFHEQLELSSKITYPVNSSTFTHLPVNLPTRSTPKLEISNYSELKTDSRRRWLLLLESLKNQITTSHLLREEQV